MERPRIGTEAVRPRRLPRCALIGLVAVGRRPWSASGRAPASASTPVTLQYWSTYNTADKEESTFENVIIPKFEKVNPGIKVNSVVYPYADLLPKFLATSAAGDPPDVMRSDIAWVPQLASQGVIVERRQAAGIRGDQEEHTARAARDDAYRNGREAGLLRVPG